MSVNSREGAEASARSRILNTSRNHLEAALLRIFGRLNDSKWSRDNCLLIASDFEREFGLEPTEKTQ